MALACDSAKPLLNEILETLKHTEEILSYIGIFYVGKLTLQTLWRILNGTRTHFFSKFSALRLLEKYGKWAVVSGSTDALGRAYALELARNGMNIILISDNNEKLKEVASEINKESSVEVQFMAVNFSSGHVGHEIITSSFLQKDIGILVNNKRFYTQQSRSVQVIPDKSMLGLVNAAVGFGPYITEVILSGMMERRRGAIINISPLLDKCFSLPFGHIANTESIFINAYSQALERACWLSGVTVQTLLLGPLSADKPSNWSSYFSCLFAPTPSMYVHHAISTLGYSGHTTGYWAHGIMRWFLQMCPNMLLMWSSIIAYK